MVREMKKKGREWQLLGEGGLCCFCRILLQWEYLVPLWNGRVFRFERALVFVFCRLKVEKEAVPLSS